jgi:hypothetical protein
MKRWAKTLENISFLKDEWGFEGVKYYYDIYLGFFWVKEVRPSDGTGVRLGGPTFRC